MKRRKKKTGRVREPARRPYSVRLPRRLVEKAKEALDEETVTGTVEEALRRQVEIARFRRFVERLRKRGGLEFEEPFA